MRILQKLEVLADAAKYDASCASSGGNRPAEPGGLGNSGPGGICHSYTPDGRCVSLLKILLTNYCVYDCRYCINRASSDVKRARFTPAEVVELTLDFYRRNYIEGLFLSSGIIQSPDYTMEQLVTVARTLRLDHRFGGYIHLKTIPGASSELVEAAGRYADRLSVNIELPTDDDLRRLAPEKSFQVIDGTMSDVTSRVEEARDERRRSPKAPGFAPAGQSTQMIVGATPTDDRTVLATAARLYSAHNLRRIYYSAFSPIPSADTSLAPAAPPLVREHRLYEADWLMRYYGYAAEELTTPDQPQLSLGEDPKRAWARRNPEFFPVDLNTGSREALLRVPGLGVRSVKRILAIRRYHSLSLADLAKLRVSLAKVRPFVVAADWLPRAAATLPDPRQLSLLDSATAVAGEL